MINFKVYIFLLCFIVLSSSLPCDNVVNDFTDCVTNSLLNGSCTLSSDGYLNWCATCKDLLSGWTDCHCNDIVAPYGLSQCHSYCTMYFSCESTLAFDDDYCKDYLQQLNQCGTVPPPTVTQAKFKDNPSNKYMINKAAAIQVNVTKEDVSPIGSFPYAHVCSITQNPAGELVAVFQAGTQEDAVDSAIWTSRRTGTNQWTKPSIAVKTPNVCDMNPSLFSDITTGTIYLTFHYGGDDSGRCNTDKWKGAYITSDTGGVTWNNKSINYLPDGYLGAIKNQCIKLSNGDVLCPSSREATVNNSIRFWHSVVERTTPTFSTWQKSNDIKFNYANGDFCVYSGNIQPVLFETAPGQVLGILRTGCKVLAHSRSTDGGKTFDEYASPLPIPNPNAGVGGTVMKQEEANLGLILVYNNSTQTRNPLSLSHSLDGGKTWEFITNIEYDPTGVHTFQYPTVIQDRTDSKVAHVCYTKGNGNMGYAKLQFSYT